MVNPKGRHAVAVGIDAPVNVEIKGSVGYYCAGMNKEATIVVDGCAGPGVAENMMSGKVVIKGDASQYAGATGRGGLLVIEGNASSRCGISMKGIDIVVKGNIGHMSAFMAQSGNLVVLGDAGDALGDSIYEARLFVRGKVKSLGADCIEKEMRPEHRGDRSGAAREGRRRTASSRASSAAMARRASSTISTSTMPMRIDGEHDLHNPPTTPRKSATFDDYTLSEIRRAAIDRHLRHPRRRREAEAAALRRSACFSAPRSRAIRSKAIASDAAPTSCSARASRRSRSS